MALFGSKRQRAPQTMDEAIAGVQQAAPQQQPRRRGLFGGAFAPKNRAGTLEVIGATLQQLDDPNGQISALQNARVERGLFGQRIRAAKDEQLQAQQEQSARQRRTDAVEQYIGTLPPEQQVQARMAYAVNPEAFAESVAQQMSGGGWQVGQGYSHTFRTRPDGTVERGDPLPLRPRAPIQGYYSPNDGAVYMDELPEDLR